MDMKLEVSMVPVSDVDRAKRFYQNLGFRLDIDYVANPNYRLIRFTPPGSEASIIIGKGITSARPGLIDGLAGGFHDGTEARAPGPDPQGRSYGSYASFRDPDGSGWLLQEIRERLPGRATQPSLNGDMTPPTGDAQERSRCARS
jgi:catechol 2,3-dioxygenase-like lactoylglutathione lyase family enzyme